MKVKKALQDEVSEAASEIIAQRLVDFWSHVKDHQNKQYAKNRKVMFEPKKAAEAYERLAEIFDDLSSACREQARDAKDCSEPSEIFKTSKSWKDNFKDPRNILLNYIK